MLIHETTDKGISVVINHDTQMVEFSGTPQECAEYRMENDFQYRAAMLRYYEFGLEPLNSHARVLDEIGEEIEKALSQGGDGQDRDGQDRDGQDRDGQGRDGQGRDGQGKIFPIL